MRLPPRSPSIRPAFVTPAPTHSAQPSAQGGHCCRHGHVFISAPRHCNTSSARRVQASVPSGDYGDQPIFIYFPPAVLPSQHGTVSVGVKQVLRRFDGQLFLFNSSVTATPPPPARRMLASVPSGSYSNSPIHRFSSAPRTCNIPQPGACESLCLAGITVIDRCCAFAFVFCHSTSARCCSALLLVVGTFEGSEKSNGSAPRIFFTACNRQRHVCITR